MKGPGFNKIIFVNGKIGFGSPPAGKAFWKESFVKGACDFFPGKNTAFFCEKDYAFTDECLIRYREGKAYAREYFDLLTDGMQKKLNAFRLVSHSMGAAFAEGVKETLYSEGWEVDFAIHINPWQPAQIELAPCKSCFVIAFQTTDDPLNLMINNKPGPVQNADLNIRENSGYSWLKFYYKHRSPIHKGRSFWKLLENELPSQKSLIGS